MRNYIFLILFAVSNAYASISVRDDVGNVVELSAPARRVVTVSPHATELVFAAGAGAQIVGAIKFSDYPDAAKNITRIGDNNAFDLEKIIVLKPDLIVAWSTGNSAIQLAQLKRLNIPIFYSAPSSLMGIADSIARLGHLLGTAKIAQEQSQELQNKITSLRKQYAHRATIRVFYQVWDQPLYTLGGQHIINDVLGICGGVNVFAELKTLAPVVSVEAVMQKDPEVIFMSRTSDADHGLGMWKKITQLSAAKRENLYILENDLLARPGPRMVLGAKNLCEKLEQVRQHKK